MDLVGDSELQKMFLSGGVTKLLTLGLFFLLKIISKKCDRNKETDCACCGSRCHTISKDTVRGNLANDARQPESI